MKTKFLSLTISLFLLLFVITPVLAIGRPSFANKPSVSPTVPQSGKLRACQARENAIKIRMTSLSRLANNIESKFDAIATRVENYYTSKVVPSGKTVSNYNALVADIATQKAAVTAALATTQTDVNSFGCSTQNPKADLVKFITDMQSVKKALKEYRTSIKNLIVAVHSVTGEGNKETPTP